MCMRAIMNNKNGFNMIMEHPNAINCIALSLNHQSLRTKSLVLELLAAICLVKGGHQLILNAFDNFKEVMIESKRFQTLMNYFIKPDEFNIDFMVACMQFINIIVHSVEDMNFRVHLQFEFTQLGLDDHLENKLRNTESEDLKVQILAYLDNFFDVGALMEDAEQKNNATDLAQQYALQLSHANELVKDFESKYTNLVHQYNLMEQEYNSIKNHSRAIEDELTNLKRSISAREEEARKRQQLLESKIQCLESKTSINGQFTPSNDSKVEKADIALSPFEESKGKNSFLPKFFKRKTKLYSI